MLEETRGRLTIDGLNVGIIDNRAEIVRILKEKYPDCNDLIDELAGEPKEGRFFFRVKKAGLIEGISAILEVIGRPPGHPSQRGLCAKTWGQLVEIWCQHESQFTYADIAATDLTPHAPTASSPTPPPLGATSSRIRAEDLAEDDIWLLVLEAAFDVFWRDIYSHFAADSDVAASGHHLPAAAAARQLPDLVRSAMGRMPYHVRRKANPAPGSKEPFIIKPLPLDPAAKARMLGPGVYMHCLTDPNLTARDLPVYFGKAISDATVRAQRFPQEKASLLMRAGRLGSALAALGGVVTFEATFLSLDAIFLYIAERLLHSVHPGGAAWRAGLVGQCAELVVRELIRVYGVNRFIEAAEKATLLKIDFFLNKKHNGEQRTDDLKRRIDGRGMRGVRPCAAMALSN